ncbi:MAG: helix-turn-helix transcriptional regulator [Treponema sp.]|nr:helix-turn-helix transcriptional regulator [Candidatus Treponema equifaecale]
MSWLEAITSSIKYMEEHLTDDITAEQVAVEVNISSLYFQKGFSIRFW